VIRQSGKYTFWGFSLSPASMTQAGKDFFVNVVVNAITTFKLLAGVSTPSINKPALSVDLQRNLLTVNGMMGDATFSVVDLSGKTVVKEQSQVQINLSGLNKGVYVVKINTNKSVVSKKFIY
jgi:predicted secreted protein